MTHQTPSVADRVAAGAAFLDQHEPGWDQRIDLDSLQLGSDCMCVLGQLATDNRHDRDWTAVVAGYGLRRMWHEDDGRPSDIALGFNAAPRPDLGALDEFTAINKEYAALTDEWRRVIEARRTQS